MAIEHVNVSGLEKFFTRHLKELRDYYFAPDNPVFWMLLLTMLFVLTRFWSMQKALSFCLIIGGILLLTTKAEGYVIGTYGGQFDPWLVKVISLVLVSVVCVYYFFIRSDVGN